MNTRFSPSGQLPLSERLFGRWDWQPPEWLRNLHPQRVMHKHSAMITTLEAQLKANSATLKGTEEEIRALHEIIHGAKGRYVRSITERKLRELIQSCAAARAAVFHVKTDSDKENSATQYHNRDAATALQIAFDAGSRTTWIRRDNAVLIVERGGLP